MGNGPPCDPPAGYLKFTAKDSPKTPIPGSPLHLKNNLCAVAQVCNQQGERCQGFNSLGFLRGKVSDMQPATDVNLYTKWGSPLLPEIPAGGPGGGLQGRVQCQPDELMVGMKVRSGRYVDGIESIECQSTKNINTRELPREVKTYWGGGGGAPQFFQCPQGQALKGYKVHAGKWMDGLQLICKPVGDDKDSTPASESPFFGTPASPMGPLVRTCQTNHFLNGVTGWGGKYFDRLQGKCKDASSFAETLNSVPRQLACCAGTLTDSFACGPWEPGSPRCLEAKRKHCARREHFFSEPCKQLFASTGRQVTNQSDNDIARRICTEVKNTPDAPEEREWCACYNAEIPTDIPPVVRGVFQCIDPECTTKGLKPYGMDCPDSLTVCTQRDFRTSLEKSKVGRQYIANECGGINIGGNGEAGRARAGWDPLVLGGLAVGATILLVILLFMSRVLSKLKQLK
jgi:hypothetical protein